MAFSSLEKLPEITLQSQDNYFVRGEFKELQIYILLTQNPLFNAIQQQHTSSHRFLDRDIPLATVNGLLLLKLYALPSLYRRGSFARVGIYENDIATLMHAYKPDISALTKELSTYVSDSDLAEIKTILSEIQQRIDRFQKGSN